MVLPHFYFLGQLRATDRTLEDDYFDFEMPKRDKPLNSSVAKVWCSSIGTYFELSCETYNERFQLATKVRSKGAFTHAVSACGKRSALRFAHTYRGLD
jgi:hypothetical protein